MLGVLSLVLLTRLATVPAKAGSASKARTEHETASWFSLGQDERREGRGGRGGGVGCDGHVLVRQQRQQRHGGACLGEAARAAVAPRWRGGASRWRARAREAG